MLRFIIFIGRINYKYYMEDLFMSKYYSINKFSKILGVSAQTLRNWDKKGKPFEIISDIGSGINYKKKGLKELIDDGGEEDDKNNSSHADPK